MWFILASSSSSVTYGAADGIAWPSDATFINERLSKAAPPATGTFGLTSPDGTVRL